MTSTLLDISEASKKLNLTPQQVRNLCRNGKIEANKLGNSWVIQEEVIDAYYDKNSCGKTEDKKYSPNTDKSIKYKKPIALSFFSGAMGMDIGLEKAGFETLLACEIDRACRKTIAKNKPDMALIGDIRDHSADEIRKLARLSKRQSIDLIVGGPPCQAFSTAGKRQAFEDERGNVFLTFLDRIIELKPKFAVIENVRGLLSAPLKHRPHEQRGKDFPPLSPDEIKGGALLHIKKTLEDAGYSVSFNLYNSANFGTPQKRERVIIVASKQGKKLPYITPTHSEKGLHGLPRWNTFEDVVSDLSPIHHQHLNFPEKRLRFYRLLGPGEYWKHLPEDLQKEALGNAYYSGGGKTGFLRRLAWDKPAPTLVTHPTMPATDLAHPVEDRPLSVQEYKRVQEFPDTWQIEGSLIEQYKQIGNAVPIGLGKAVGNLIIKALKKQKIESFDDFSYSRYANTNEISWHEEVSKLILKSAS